MLMYEVDLRDRKSGNSVECIYSGSNYDEAYKIAGEYNKENVLDYNENYTVHDYIDGADGLLAEVYHIENETDLHGVGKFD